MADVVCHSTRQNSKHRSSSFEDSLAKRLKSSSPTFPATKSKVTSMQSVAMETKQRTTPAYEEDSFMCDSDPTLGFPSVDLATPDSQIDPRVRDDVQQPLSNIQHDHTYFLPPSLVGQPSDGAESDGAESGPTKPGVTEGMLSQELFSEEEGGDREEVLSEVEKCSLGNADMEIVGVASSTHIQEGTLTDDGVSLMEGEDTEFVSKTVGVGGGVELVPGANASTLEPNSELPDSVSELQVNKMEPESDRMELDSSTLIRVKQDFEHHASNVTDVSQSASAPLPPVDHTHPSATRHVRNPLVGQILEMLPSLNTVMEKAKDVTVEELDDVSQLLIHFLATINTRRRNCRSSRCTCNNVV